MYPDSYKTLFFVQLFLKGPHQIDYQKLKNEKNRNFFIDFWMHISDRMPGNYTGNNAERRW